ncbi:divergent polysaccharide deacetylase family protein [Loktanella sp. SALINAS62]|uniref:divergent polysaccharide deacetylase family protein n=1 Tax=Loktanella sp. SALINAS62 TaxID=2706124 RepID=UPI001B8ADE2D|nr:divergent polysaccharide deacetylase family protein [Loktanella sp. SALINAS62]MBS1301669.1 hypothetical protein [Loktanella sp. SALINAS62]
MAFVKGAVLGLVVGGVAVATGSLIAPQPASNLPPALPQVDVTQTDSTVQPVTPATPPASVDEPAPRLADEPAMAEPADPTDAPAPDTSPATAPDLTVVDNMPTAPMSGRSVDIATAPEEPVLPNPQSITPSVPDSESNVQVSTAPPPPVIVIEDATPPANAETDDPVTVIIDTPAPLEPDATTSQPDAVPMTAPDMADAPDAPEPVVADPDDDTTESPSASRGLTTDSADTVTLNTPADRVTPDASSPDMSLGDPDTPDQPGLDTATDDTSSAELAVVDPTTRDEPAADPLPADPVAPDTSGADEPATPTVVTIIDTPPGATTDNTTGVTVRRPGTTPAPAPADAADQTVDDRPPLERYAAFFDNPADLPLMSVVIIDNGVVPNGPRALAEVPFPVTIVLDPSRPDVSDLMDAYRAAGIEVASRASLPQGGTAADISVALEATFDVLPETIALVQTDPAGFGRSDPATARVVGALAADGRGLLLPDGGFSGAQDVADAQSLPNATIFRDLSDVDQDARVIRRFMDQAAFRAGQQDGVVLLAQLTPETLSALILWGAANRSRQVAMAPLSATLLANSNSAD